MLSFLSCQCAGDHDAFLMHISSSVGAFAQENQSVYQTQPVAIRTGAEPASDRSNRSEKPARTELSSTWEVHFECADVT